MSEPVCNCTHLRREHTRNGCGHGEFTVVGGKQVYIKCTCTVKFMDKDMFA